MSGGVPYVRASSDIISSEAICMMKSRVDFTVALPLQGWKGKCRIVGAQAQGIILIGIFFFSSEKPWSQEQLAIEASTTMCSKVT